MNLKQATYIYTIYEEGNISNAAKRLFISQPALSQTVQAVEKEIGAKIFDRSTSPITLTHAGRCYIDAVTKMMLLESDFQRKLQEVKDETAGRIRIGIPTLRAQRLLPAILPEYSRVFPRVKLVIREAGSMDQQEALLSNRVDLAFLVSHEPMKGSDINYIKLCQERILLVADPRTRFAQTHVPRSTVHIADAKNERFVALHKGHGVRAMQEYLFTDQQMAPDIMLELESADSARQVAAACGALALYPEVLMTPEMLDDPNYPYYYIEEKYTRNYYVCHYRDMYLPRYMTAFIDMAKRYFVQLQRQLEVRSERLEA